MEKIPYKFCPRCETEKPCFEFNRQVKNWDGFARMCKECQKKARKPSERQIISRYVPSLCKRSW
jgi:hypothetical protein